MLRSRFEVRVFFSMILLSFDPEVESCSDRGSSACSQRPCSQAAGGKDFFPKDNIPF